MRLERASSAPDRREGRVRLSVRDPRTEKTLAGLNLGETNVEDLRSLCNRLQRDADAWMRRGGFSDRAPRLRKQDADRALRAALRNLEGAYNG
jgi:membrane-bound lytic murein transglycosylase MltF